MTQNLPLVTIGIPTYNRVMQLNRAIDSALNQDYDNIEVIVSDNASTDETGSVCRKYCDKDSRLKYSRQVNNLGPTANFNAALKTASGEYFMWLGDDDWIDTDYVSSCLRELSSDSSVSLVSGVPQYYRKGVSTRTGVFFSLLQDSAWRRVVEYYAKVADNGMFYGLMRTEQIREFEITNLMGGDWLMIASVAFTGKVKTLTGIYVHREMGGATASYRKIREILGLSRLESIHPKLSIAGHAWKDIVLGNSVYRSRNILERLTAGTLIFFMLVMKSILHNSRAVLRRLAKRTKDPTDRQFLPTEKHDDHIVDCDGCVSDNSQRCLPERPDREQ